MRSPRFIWLTLLVVESLYIVLRRVALAHFDLYSLEAEVISTALRLACVGVYVSLLGRYLRVSSVSRGFALQPAALAGLVLFLAVPLLVGNMAGMDLQTRVIYALTSFVVGLKEEIVFRGLLQNLLSDRWGKPAAIFLAALLFVAYHIGTIPPTAFAYGQALICGLILGVIYAHTRSLWTVIWLHTLYDALWLITPVLPTPLPYEGGLALLAVALLLLSRWARPTLRA